MDLSSILDECLARLLNGESIDACLASYPEYAGELAPLLGAGQQLRLSLRQARLTQGQRLRAKIALREALAAQSRLRVGALGTRTWGGARVFSAAGIVAVLLFLVVAVAAVASSRPDSPVYPLRLVAERAPLLMEFSPAGKAEREIVIADRRLSELRDELMTAGRIAPAALNEMLRLDAAALSRAEHLPRAERAAIVSLVAAHGAELSSLAGMARDADSLAQLKAAAEKVRLLAQQQDVVVEPEQPVVAPSPTPTGATAAGATATVTVGARLTPSDVAPTETLSPPPAATATDIAEPPADAALPTQPHVEEATETTTPAADVAPTATRKPRRTKEPESEEDETRRQREGAEATATSGPDAERAGPTATPTATLVPPSNNKPPEQASPGKEPKSTPLPKEQPRPMAPKELPTIKTALPTVMAALPTIRAALPNIRAVLRPTTTPRH